MSTKIPKITRMVYRALFRGINQSVRVGTHEEMENAQNRLLRLNTTNRWTGTQFMGIYGRMEHSLWVFMGFDVYGHGPVPSYLWFIVE